MKSKIKPLMTEHNKTAIHTDKKSNAVYWDAIDNVIVDCIQEVAKYSTSNTVITFDEDKETTTDHCYCDLFSDGIVGEVRDTIIQYLTKAGAKFPFVNENM